MALLQSAHKLATGELHLPMEREPIPIDICRMQDIAKIGSADLYRKDGPFIMIEDGNLTAMVTMRYGKLTHLYNELWLPYQTLKRYLVQLKTLRLNEP